MARPSRTRRILKWTGVGLSLLIFFAWGFSLKYAMQVRVGQRGFIFIYGGVIRVMQIHGPPSMDPGSGIGWLGWSGIQFVKPELRWNGTPPAPFDLVFPYWLLLLTAIPTAWLWHRDRRRIRPGCCLRCGYDLTGNTSGVCPECGDKVHPPAVLADSECGEAKPPPSTLPTVASNDLDKINAV